MRESSIAKIKEPRTIATPIAAFKRPYAAKECRMDAAPDTLLPIAFTREPHFGQTQPRSFVKTSSFISATKRLAPAAKA